MPEVASPLDVDPTEDYPLDAYTRLCRACSQAYQADDYDDPDLGGPPWQQAIGPCCHANPGSPTLEAV